jgi:nitrogenase subunit NifH
MAAITETATKRIHAVTSGTTAETWALSEKCQSVEAYNGTAGRMFVTVITSRTAVTDDAGITAAVADADNTYVVPTLTWRTIANAGRPTFFAGSVLGNTTTYDIEGRDYRV